MLPHGTGGIQPLHALFGIGLSIAQGTAETTKFFHTVQIVAVLATSGDENILQLNDIFE